MLGAKKAPAIAGAFPCGGVDPNQVYVVAVHPYRAACPPDYSTCLK